MARLLVQPVVDTLQGNMLYEILGLIASSVSIASFVYLVRNSIRADRTKDVVVLGILSIFIIATFGSAYQLNSYQIRSRS